MQRVGIRYVYLIHLNMGNPPRRAPLRSFFALKITIYFFIFEKYFENQIRSLLFFFLIVEVGKMTEPIIS